MVEVLDGRLIGRRSAGSRICLHSPSAVNAKPVPSSELLLDIGRNTEAVGHADRRRPGKCDATG